MGALAGLRHRLRWMFTARRLRRELEEEMRIHVELDAEARRRRGDDPEGAARAFGDVQAWAEQVERRRTVFGPRMRRRGLLLGSSAFMMFGGTGFATVTALSWQVRHAGAGDSRFTFVLVLLVGAAALVALVGAIGSAQLSVSASRLRAEIEAVGRRPPRAAAVTGPVGLALGGAVVLTRALTSALVAAVPAEALVHAPALGQANVSIAFVIGVTLVVALPSVCVGDLRSCAGYWERAAAWWRSGAAAVLVRGARQTQAGFTLLIVGVAAVMGLSVFKLQQADIGVESVALWKAQITLGPSLDPESRGAVYAAIQHAVQETQDVSDVGSVTHFPLTRASVQATTIISGGRNAGRLVRVRLQHASAGYFATAGIPVVAGRPLRPHDVRGAARVSLVNDSFAILNWGSAAAAVGETIDVLDEPHVVIGVTGNVLHHGAHAYAAPELYIPLARSAPAAVDLVFAAPSAAAAQRAINEAAVAAGSAADVSPVISMHEVRRRFYAPTRLVALMLTTMAALSLLLTTITRRATRRHASRPGVALSGSWSLPWVRALCSASTGAVSTAIIAKAMQPVSFGLKLSDVMLLVTVSAIISFVIFNDRMRSVPGRRF